MFLLNSIFLFSGVGSRSRFIERDTYIPAGANIKRKTNEVNERGQPTDQMTFFFMLCLTLNTGFPHRVQFGLFCPRSVGTGNGTGTGDAAAFVVVVSR